ncbi:DNA polymerase Y family protein [Subtercola sp. YIM 133946]|uniref:DNA polymerase Y family protein n=1 Tax=Subtercola sp. YIM 133946 TaxID=3118909 RepID=UPI002F9355C7
MGAGDRTLVVWIPDWPVRAHALVEEIAADSPIALVDRGVVFACSAAARAEGVRRGLRIREAQAKCPELLAIDYDPALDHRSFEPVISAIEEIMPGVQVLRPGTCALRSRGPARYYGGEQQTAQVLLNTLASLPELALTGGGGASVGVGDASGGGASAGGRATSGGGGGSASGGRGGGAAWAAISADVLDAHIAIADGRFAAEQASRMPGGPIIRIIPPGGSPGFLAPHPIETIGDPPLATLLRRLGLTTLGDFAGLDFRDVRARFGETGVHAHTLASGADVRRVTPRLPPRLRDVELSFEPPLEVVDQITFAFRTTAERLVDELAQALLVCTGIRVELHTDRGKVHERSWGHPRWFSAADVLDRIRWQVQGRTGAGNGALGSAIARVRVLPEELDSIGNYEAGLWGSTPDDRVHHGLSRVQSLLGHEGVVTASIGGGRGVAERQVLVPWGDPVAAAPKVAPPWPGAIPLPAPSTVFERPQAVVVRGADGGAVEVSERGVLSGIPSLFAPTMEAAGDTDARGARSAAIGMIAGGRLELGAVQAWAGPWAVQERWWDSEKARSFHRFQVVDESGTAWLLALHGREWWAEARYD